MGLSQLLLFLYPVVCRPVSLWQEQDSLSLILFQKLSYLIVQEYFSRENYLLLDDNWEYRWERDYLWVWINMTRYKLKTMNLFLFYFLLIFYFLLHFISYFKFRIRISMMLYIMTKCVTYVTFTLSHVTIEECRRF